MSPARYYNYEYLLDVYATVLSALFISFLCDELEWMVIKGETADTLVP